MNEWLPSDEPVQSVDALAEYLIEVGREEFTSEEIGHLNFNTGRPVHALRADLEGWGFRIAKRPVPRRVRGFTVSSHDRWYGPGSSPCHGGSGWEQISGFAGREG